MVTKVHLDALKSEAASVEALLARISDKDIVSRLSLAHRLEALQQEITEHANENSTLAGVALIFDGDPVTGSSSIDAEFAGKTLQNYQELISKQVAFSAGMLGPRGPVPIEAQEAARMHVKSLIHGSFGFVLEEARADEPGMFDSPVKIAISQISDIMIDVAATNLNAFNHRLEDMDFRVFNTLKKFVSVIYKARATVRVAEREREVRFDLAGLGRAYERLRETDVSETEEMVEGELLGIVPIQRRFEFRRGDTFEVIKGRVSQMLSADYLERLERDGIMAGLRWRATIRTKSVEHPDGRHASKMDTLIDLVQI
ncbi:hypothetical protein [Blastomonas sp. SL216]|uniref:hypothetical protein n=1 Tax=Blastomonas sp. SL216 TaxID=2995169 RepID=UPI002377412B|nr:hypothetical protein OU999_04120 [Blastomonas sp. SL216]